MATYYAVMEEDPYQNQDDSLEYETGTPLNKQTGLLFPRNSK